MGIGTRAARACALMFDDITVNEQVFRVNGRGDNNPIIIHVIGHVERVFIPHIITHDVSAISRNPEVHPIISL